CAFAKVQAAEVKAYDLAEADASRVYEFQDGAIAGALRGLLVRGGDKGRQMLLRKDCGETALSLGRVHAGEGVRLKIAFAHEEAEEIARGAYLTREAGGNDASIAGVSEVAAEGLAIGVQWSNVFILLEIASGVEAVCAVIREGGTR